MVYPKDNIDKQRGCEMRNLLDKLDKIAGQWVDALDNQLEETMIVTRVITGDVFTNTPANDHNVHEQPVRQEAQLIIPNPRSTCDPTEGDALRSPVLRKAR
jgi:hypothetical protein